MDRQRNVPIEMVRLAKEQGHPTMFTPPYYYDLQPIGLLWAQVKGTVPYRNNKNRLMDETNQYDIFKPESWYDFILGLVRFHTSMFLNLTNSKQY